MNKSIVLNPLRIRANYPQDIEPPKIEAFLKLISLDLTIKSNRCILISIITTVIKNAKIIKDQISQAS